MNGKCEGNGASICVLHIVVLEVPLAISAGPYLPCVEHET